MSSFTTEPQRAQRKDLDIGRIRGDFPILSQSIHGKPLVYLDNAATAQKPQIVIDALTDFYTTTNANIHRGVHSLSVEATRRYEKARDTLRDFLGAERSEEIVFCRGATEAINLVAQAWARPRLQAGDEIIISTMEHHSNIVPWQMVCEQTGAKLKVIPITDSGELMLDDYEKLFSDKTKLVATTHVSNALGTITPVKEIIAMAHDRGVPVLLDGAQAAPHLPIEVQDIDVDFYAVSGHKMFGPTGIGVLYAKHDLLEEMEPYQGGGEMILSVTFDNTTYNRVPHKFEAGTPNIAGAIGLAAAAKYLQSLNWTAIETHERELLEYATAQLSKIPGTKIIGTAPHKAGVLSFVMEGIHPHDIGTILDSEGVAVRTGHHCAQPVMERFGLTATTRASLAFYNTKAEIDALIRGLSTARKVFGP